MRQRESEALSENIRERNSLQRSLERLNRSMRDVRGFSNFAQGESVTNYHKCNLCHNTWCLPCQGRLDNCPYCRN